MSANLHLQLLDSNRQRKSWGNYESEYVADDPLLAGRMLDFSYVYYVKVIAAPKQQGMQ
jgi:hypothetical protein